MIFEEFDYNKHDYHKVAKLIFSVDGRTYSKVFKTSKKAMLTIEKLLLVGNDLDTNRDSINEKNIKLYIVRDDDLNKSILGILHVVKGKKNSLLNDIFFVFKNLAIADAFRFSFIYFLDFLVLSSITQHDYYIAELAVDESQRGKGIGKKILKKAIKAAKEEKYSRVVLDVDLNNERAIKLYESLGFKKFNKKSVKFFNKERGMYNMEYFFQ